MVIPEIQVPASSFCKNTVLTQYGEVEDLGFSPEAQG